MSGRYLLDTNIVIGLLARKSGRAAENITRLDAMAATIPVLGCDTRAARRNGEIKDELRRKGQPIPENDIWIAAIALAHGLILVTRDAHLRHIDNLEVSAW